MGADRMAEVQLDDDPAAPREDPRPPSAAARRARALLRRWWPAPVAVVLALVAVQAVADRGAEARADRLRATPGVLGETITAPLDATPLGSPDALGLLATGRRTPDGLVAGVLGRDPDGRAAVVALDRGTGDEVWRAEIGTGLTQSAVCTAGTGPAALGAAAAETLWCTVTDAGSDAAAAGATDAPAGPTDPAATDLRTPEVSTRLVEVDLVSRAVVGARELEPGAEATVVGDVLVVGTPGDGGLLLRGSEVRGGAELWRTVVPDSVDPDVANGWLGDLGGHVFARGADATWSVDPEDGRVEAHAPALYAARGDALVAVPTAGAVQLLGADGSGTASLDGYPLDVSPDDGTAAGIQPVSAPDGTGTSLRGVDVASGDVRWERPGRVSPRSGYLVLGGVLYGSDLETLWAVDAVTGDERWSVTTDPVEDTPLMTDGRHLLRAERADGSADLVLSAYDLGSGRRAWTTPVPEGVEALWPLDGALYGYGGDGTEVVRLR